MTLFPIVALEPCDLAEANRLLDRWQHPLGACRRPFGTISHVMRVGGDVVGVTVSASTVSARAAGMARTEVVELARLARSPDARWVLRPLLRIWREALVFEWPYWRVRAVVSYALPGTPGDLYRFDGWERVGESKPWAGGATWSNPSRANDIADGVKTLWRYVYPADQVQACSEVPA